jgi:uncharacterized RDD family membrane protein YckC
MEDTRPAGFWIRAVAALVDFSVFFFVQMSFGFIAGKVVGPDVEDTMAFLPLVWMFTLLFAAVYTTVLHGRVGGQTIGKMLVGIRVVDVDGATVSVGAALLRFGGYFGSLAMFGLGYVMAALRRDKRAFHDLIAGTRVERIAPPRPHTVASDPVGHSSASSS